MFYRRLAHLSMRRSLGLGISRLGRVVHASMFNSQFVFAITTLTLLAARVVHLYAHLDEVPEAMRRDWSWSFLGQDFAVIPLLRWLADRSPKTAATTGQRLLNFANRFLVCYIFTTCLSSVSFFLVSGVEVHWRNITEVSDPANQAILLTGLPTFLMVLGSLVTAALVTKRFLFDGASFVLDGLSLLVHLVRSRIPFSQQSSYSVLHSVTDDERDGSSAFTRHDLSFRHLPLLGKLNIVLKLAASLFLLANIIAVVIRPSERATTFICWTTPLLPFIDINSADILWADLPQLHHGSIGMTWDNLTSVQKPLELDWLPKDKPLQGFEDWYQSKTTYNAAADPLRISNLQQDFLPGLRDALKEIDIQHVLIFMLEGTRKDVFPFKKNSSLFNFLQNSFPSKQLPEDAQRLLANLTPAANYITGDYDDGFPHASRPKRGGINFNNANSAASFTLKSLMAVNCGLTPLTADFDMEYKYHFYQPCLSHIFRAMNEVNKQDHAINKTIPARKWYTSFMQSVSLGYIHFYALMAKCGFESMIDKDYLMSDDAKFGKVEFADVNYFGFEETPLEPYIRDQFATAKKNNDRVFLNHITSTSHHPFRLPPDENYVQVAHGGGNNEYLSGYINTIAYDDTWISRILNVLDEEGVANETLVIFQGDHGLSMVENSLLSNYYNPHFSTFHVPLVLSNPLLPSLQINESVNAAQILPTVLDILIESGSLSDSSLKVAKDLIGMYEGQSLIRKPVHESIQTKQGNWQFAIVSPGSPMVAARDTRFRELRLVVPIIENETWRFSNLTDDPLEEHAVLGTEYRSFMAAVESRYGKAAAEWVEEGAFIVRWWLDDQKKRWRYGPYHEQSL